MPFSHQLRDECLANVRKQLEEKEADLESKLRRVRAEIESGSGSGTLTADALNSKRFHMNVIETRLVRQGRGG